MKFQTFLRTLYTTSWEPRPPDKTTPNTFLSSSHNLKFNEIKQKIVLFYCQSSQTQGNILSEHIYIYTVRGLFGGSRTW